VTAKNGVGSEVLGAGGEERKKMVVEAVVAASSPLPLTPNP
jgi:hypothetical protein